ncbi:MAG: acyl-CoA dehydrogenase family protein, partial [Candidatus Hodarchaeota archaeon]
MNELFFSENELALQKEIREFLSRELGPLSNNIGKDSKVPISLIKELGKRGLIGPLIPKIYNGTDYGLIAHCMITEEISRYNVAVSVTRTPCILDGYLLNKYGNNEQKEIFLKNIATGDKLCSICVTEEEAGSNVAGIKTSAIREGNNYILNGSKRYITNAGIADYYFIWSITDKNVNPRNGMSVFLVEKDTPGLEVENPYNLLGVQGIYNGIIYLNNVVIPKENLIGTEGSGFQSLMDTFNIERMTLSAECNGISIAALEKSKDYA